MVSAAVAASMAVASTEPPDWQLSASGERIAWLASVAWLASKAQAVHLQWRPPIADRDDIQVGLTGRLLDTNLLVDGAAGEVGLCLAYAPVHRVYQPSMGLEVGWSGGARFDWADYFGKGWQEQDPVARADYAPIYAGVTGQPLRFGYRAASVSTMGVSVGQMGLGRVLRLHVSLITAGVQF